MPLSYSKPTLLALVGFVLLVLSITVGMFALRHQVLTNASSDMAQEDWETWRDFTQSQSAESESTERGPVVRQVPRVAEPPVLVWMRDYFGVGLVTLLVMSSTLYGFFTFMLIGVLSEKK